MNRSTMLVRAGWCLLAMSCQPALAAGSGEITVTGNVPILCSLEVQQEPGAVNIADISAGHTDRRVATVTENCNSPDGYTVTMLGSNSSDHTGMFVDAVSTDA